MFSHQKTTVLKTRISTTQTDKDVLKSFPVKAMKCPHVFTFVGHVNT